MSAEELAKLEELFAGGFILKDEYDLRIVALQNKGGSQEASTTADKPAGDPVAEDEFAWLKGPEDYPRLVELVNDPDPTMKYKATCKVRKLLCVEQAPPIKEMIDIGLVPILVKYLADGSQPRLQFEAAWALTNIASGNSNCTRTVVDAGAIPIFVSLLSSPDDDIREQCLWALGNIAGDSFRARDHVLDQDAVPALVAELTKETKVSILRNGTWALSNMCRGKPAPNFETLTPALPLLTSKLLMHQDEEVQTDAMWALSYLTDGANTKIQAVLDTGVAPQLVNLLKIESPKIQTPTLRTIGNIVTGDDSQTQVMLDLSVTKHLCDILKSKAKKTVRKETIWAISNITAGSRDQIQHVFNENIFPELIPVLSFADADLKKEAAWAVGNAITGGSKQQVAQLVGLGVLPPICALLSDPDDRVVIVALETLTGVSSFLVKL